MRAPGEPPCGAIRIRRRAARATLVLRGEIDLDVVRAFEESQGRTPTTVEDIDAGEVTHLSAAAVALMVRCREEAVRSGRTLVLSRSNPHVDRVLSLLDLASSFR